MENFRYDWERLRGLYSDDFVERMKDDPCWKGYQMVGMKKKGGRSVPNCVPLESKHSENPLDEMVVGPALKREPAKSKPLMGQSDKRVKSRAIIQ